MLQGKEIEHGNYPCQTCGGNHALVAINRSTVVTEFSYNYYIPNGKCYHNEEDRYCILAKWVDFCSAPESFINSAYNKKDQPIADNVKVFQTG